MVILLLFSKLIWESRSPASVITEMLASSFSMLGNEASLKAGVGALTASTARGLLQGAATGNPLGVVYGGVKGLAQGIPYAMSVASTTAATGVMFMDFVSEELAKQGKEVNRENVRDIIENDELFNRFRSESLKYGGTLGSIDIVTAKMASAVGAKIIGRGMRGTGATTQMVGEGLGGAEAERLAQKSIGREVSGFEYGAEFISQVALGAPGAFGNIVKGALGKPLVKGSYKINNETVSRDAMLRQVSMTPDGDVSKVNFEVKNDASLQDLIDAKRKRHQIRESLPDNLSDSQREALVDLELQKTMMGATDTESAKRKMDDINSKIKEILDGKPEEKVQEDTKEEVAEKVEEDVQEEAQEEVKEEVAPDVEVQVNGEAYKVVTDPETGKVSEVVRVSTNRKAKAGSKNYKAAEAAAKKLTKKKKGKPAKSKKEEVEISEEEALMQEFEAQKDKRSFEVAEPGEVKPSMGVSTEGAKLLNALSRAFGAKVVVHANLESIAATSLPAYQAQKQGKKRLDSLEITRVLFTFMTTGRSRLEKTMVHEFLHAENANNPEFMKSIFDVLQNRAKSDTSIAEIIANVRKNYEGVSGYDEASLMDEVVATFGEEAQARNYDSNIFGDIRRLVNSFVDKLPIPDDVKKKGLE